MKSFMKRSILSPFEWVAMVLMFLLASGAVGVAGDTASASGLAAKAYVASAQPSGAPLYNINAGLQNYRPGSLDIYKKARAQVRAGTASTTVAVAGSSLAMGAYGGDAVVAAARPNAPSVRLAPLLTTAGLPASAQSFFGSGSTTSGNAFNIFDNRLTLGSWSTNVGVTLSAGGYGARATNSGTMAFTFSGDADSITIYEGQYPTAGAYSANIDGTTTITASQATNVATQSVAARTFTFAAIGGGNHTLNINWVSGSPIVFGAMLHLSTTKQVRLLNIGIGGSKAGEWSVAASNFYSPLFVVPNAINPSLIWFEIGANDWIGGTDLTTFYNQCVAIITAWKATSSVIVKTPWPSRASTTPIATQQLYVDALIAAAVATGVPYVDEWRIRQNGDVMNTLGAMQDGVHPNSVGVWMTTDLMNSVMAQVN